MKVKFDWTSILAIAAVGGLGYVAYKFIKGNWKLPSLGGLLGLPDLGIGGLGAALIPSILPKTGILADLGGTIPEEVYPKVITANPLYQSLADLAFSIGKGLNIGGEGPPLPAIIPIETIVAKYEALPHYGEAGISTAIGQEFQRRTGRILAQ